MPIIDWKTSQEIAEWNKETPWYRQERTPYYVRDAMMEQRICWMYYSDLGKERDKHKRKIWTIFF